MEKQRILFWEMLEFLLVSSEVFLCW